MNVATLYGEMIIREVGAGICFWAVGGGRECSGIQAQKNNRACYPSEELRAQHRHWESQDVSRALTVDGRRGQKPLGQVRAVLFLSTLLFLWPLTVYKSIPLPHPPLSQVA